VKRMVVRIVKFLPVAAALLLAGSVLFNVSAISKTRHGGKSRHAASFNHRLFVHGRHVFRFDTFGDQRFWGGQLHLQKAIEGAKLGGVGPGLSPAQALAAGLKVDANALPAPVVKAIKQGKVDLNSPKTTLALLKLNAVVGVKGLFNRHGTLRSVGLTCAVCHSTVNDSFAKGIGQRLDGWANRDLNVGAIISLAPRLKPVTDLLGADAATVRKVLATWGPGKFDAKLFLDGKAFQPNGKSAADLIPSAYGLNGVNLATYTGFGQMTYWNAFVANLEMHGQGNFLDMRLDDPAQFPLAVKSHVFEVRHKHDRITKQLGALQYYQLGLRPPVPPKGSFNRAAARRGKAIFDGQGKCASCHVPPTFSDPGENLHPSSQVCEDNFEASRSPTHMLRTTPLRGLWARKEGGFYHDGRFATLGAVVRHYNRCFGLDLSAQDRHDLAQYLKSIH
jgi:mono/diheme cytochrome c family protein